MSTSTTTTLAELPSFKGKELGTSDWFEITQERVNTFADATDDHQWIHTDPRCAADGPFGGTIAHGYLTLSLLIPLFNRLLEVRGVAMSINYGLERVRFPSPVKVGAKIRLLGRVEGVEDVPGGVQMTLDFTVECDGSAKPACVARALYRHHA